MYGLCSVCIQLSVLSCFCLPVLCSPAFVLRYSTRGPAYRDDSCSSVSPFVCHWKAWRSSWKNVLVICSCVSGRISPSSSTIFRASVMVSDMQSYSPNRWCRVSRISTVIVCALIVKVLGIFIVQYFFVERGGLFRCGDRVRQLSFGQFVPFCHVYSI